MKKSYYWWTGQIASPLIGIAVSTEYSIPAGISTLYIFLLLVDIRESLMTPNNEVRGAKERSS